ncbi:MAG: hypothetical protein M5R42_05695 [Rhodocyclaceae bacterium]|nr:hypothetical protein [Rhodocyclaceae bacterium]
MRLLPKSLFGQIVLALVSGLVVAHVVGAWLMLDDRARFGERLRGEYAAQRIAGLITLLDGTAPEERRRVVRALSVPPTRLSPRRALAGGRRCLARCRGLHEARVARTRTAGAAAGVVDPPRRAAAGGAPPNRAAARAARRRPCRAAPPGDGVGAGAAR